MNDDYFMFVNPQNSEKVPPPWLIAMQRYGPPPSYPNLKIAGLNGPIPEVSFILFCILIKLRTKYILF